MYTWKPTWSESNIDITDSYQCRPINDSSVLLVSASIWSDDQTKQTFTKKDKTLLIADIHFKSLSLVTKFMARK